MNSINSTTFDANFLGRNFAQGFISEITSQVSGIGSGIGNFLGTGLSDGISSAVKGIDFTKIFNDIVDELNKATSSSSQRIDFHTSAKHFGDELGEAIKAAGMSSTNAFNEVLGNFFRGATLNTVPYLASASLILLGVPHCALYAYNKAKHNIGRPKLASEEHRVGFIDRTTDAITRTATSGFQSLVSGVKWGAITAGAAMVGFLPTAIYCDYNRYWDGICDRGSYNSSSAYYNASMAAIFGMAGVVCAGSVLSKGAGWWKKKLIVPADPKPIFNDQLSAEIKEITDSVNNLRKNKGYFQNVLLYGPGGTGKTMVAMEIAKNSKMNFIKMS